MPNKFVLYVQFHSKNNYIMKQFTNSYMPRQMFCTLNIPLAV